MALIAAGTLAPAFKAVNLTGPEVDSDRFRGQKAFVLIFSSSRIDPVQINAVKGLWLKVRDKAEVITVSFKLPSVAMAKAFMMQLGAKFPALYDPAQTIYKAYGVEHPVALVIVDARGQVVHAAEGLDTSNTKALEEALVAHL